MKMIISSGKDPLSENGLATYRIETIIKAISSTFCVSSEGRDREKLARRAFLRRVYPKQAPRSATREKRAGIVRHLTKANSVDTESRS